MILFGVIFSFIYYKLDLTRKKIFAWPLIIFIIFYSVSFDVIDIGNINTKIFINFKLNLSLRSYIFYLFTCCAFAIGVHVACTQCKSPVTQKHWNYNLRKVKTLYYFFAILTLIGFCINLSRVIGNMGMLFVSPREYEELFGASSLINYLYFLNIPALCLSVLLSHYKQKVKYSIFFNILMVLVSFFHGIKFTIFDTIAYPALFYYFLKSNVSLKKILSIFFVLIGIFILFATFVRGAESGSPLFTLLCYIIPNFYNLEYNIEYFPDNWGDFASLITPQLIPSPTTELGHIEMPKTGFIFNESYNMYTSLLPLFQCFNLFGPFFYIPIFYFQLFVYRNRKYSLSYLFLAVYMEYSLYFAFYFYAYTKFKNFFYVILFICIDYYCRKSQSRNNVLN